MAVNNGYAGSETEWLDEMTTDDELDAVDQRVTSVQNTANEALTMAQANSEFCGRGSGADSTECGARSQAEGDGTSEEQVCFENFHGELS